jgi:thymidylate synthase
MSVIDKNYHELLNKILKEGFRYEDPNRKDVFRLQIPHYTITHDFKDGFPAITTKQLYWKGVVGELLWFLRVDTNIKYLVDNGINIWNKDAYNYYLKVSDFPGQEFAFMSFENFIETIKTCDSSDLEKWWEQEHFNIKYNLGDLGRVYGAQWRKWHMGCDSFGQRNLTKDGYDEIDQISNLIKGLKDNPMGTRHIVTAWNPAELDDMALPPCHWSFEVLVEPIITGDREDLYVKNTKDLSDFCSINKNFDEFFDINNIPKYKFTLKWHQRSVDTFLGLPFNIASYALLAQIIGKMTNMVPKCIIGDLSNVHIYENHLHAVKEQLSRDVDKYDKCELRFAREESNQGLEKGEVDIFNHLEIRNFRLRDYESYPTINAEMLAYNK